MLSFGLRVSWFILSLSGLLSCWVTLWSFGRVVGSKWASIVYCLGTTLAQGIFCVGIVYRLDPLLMAHSFCLAQNILMSAGAFINIGVVFALTVATNMAVRKPKTWGDAHRALQWQKIFWLPVVVAPLLATAFYLALSFSFRSVAPSDGMWCDSTEPEWIRLLGPFGVPFLLSIPVLYLSIQSFLRIRRTRLHLLRSRPECQTSPTNNPRTCSQHPAAWRKKSRVSLRDVAKMPVTLALTISKKSSLASMRVWKGMGMKKCATASAVDGVGMSMNAVALKETGPQGQRSLQTTRSVTQSLPPTALPLALLRSDDGSLESLRSASDIIIRSVGFGGKGERNTHDITVESRRSLSSKFSLRDRESASEVRKSNSSSAFASDKSPPPEMKSCSDSKSTSTKDRVPNDGEPLVTGSPASQMFRISLVDEDEEAEVDVHRGPAGSKRDVRSSILHAIELVAGESVSVDERQTDDEEKADLKFVVDAEVALTSVEDTKDDFMEKSSTPSVTKKRPTSMIFTLDGPYKKPKHQPAWLAPALWHVILFQFAFVFIQFLTFLTTFVDVVSGQQTPSRFGSQHLALLLAAWCPVVIFGSLPVVRRNLIPWRPILIS